MCIHANRNNQGHRPRALTLQLALRLPQLVAVVALRTSPKSNMQLLSLLMPKPQALVEPFKLSLETLVEPFN